MTELEFKKLITHEEFKDVFETSPAEVRKGDLKKSIQIPGVHCP